MIFAAIDPLPLIDGCVERCPGCAHRALSPSESRGRKDEWLARALAPWAQDLEPVRAADPVDAEIAEGRGYREKTTLRASWKDGAWRFGLRRRLPGAMRGKAEYELVEIPRCPVHSPRVRRALDFLSARLPGPDQGLALEFVVVTGKLATLVVKSSAESITPILDERLRGACRDATSHGLDGVWLNFNPSAGQRVFSPSPRSWRLVHGAARAPLGFSLGAATAEWSYGPSSFQQLLPTLYAGALAEARAHLRPVAGDRVLDLCSGLGLTLGLWRECGADTLGVELGGESVESARAALGPDVCLRGRVSERLPQLDRWLGDGRAGARLAFVNPPRLGLEASVTRWLGESARPVRIAYLSCSAGTLARDLDLLVARGYAVGRIIPYDFFPRTHHVEALALLSLGSA